MPEKMLTQIKNVKTFYLIERGKRSMWYTLTKCEFEFWNLRFDSKKGGSLSDQACEMVYGSEIGKYKFNQDTSCRFYTIVVQNFSMVNVILLLAQNLRFS